MAPRARSRLTPFAIGLLVLATGCGGGGGEPGERERPQDGPPADFFVPRPTSFPLGETEQVYEIYDHLLESIDFDREKADIQRMTRGQSALYALAVTDGEIQNGGLDQYFWNSSGALFNEAVAGADLFGAGRYAEILRQAGALFSDGQVPEDRPARQRALDDAPEQEISALTDRWYAAWTVDPLDQYYLRYVNGHPDEFFRD